jgi:cysteine desulfurase/selenocysteine lyase
MDNLQVKDQFPALHQTVYGKPLVYLDSGATAQKPRIVLDAMQHYYENDNANVHRGVHALSQRADQAFDSVRKKVKSFIHAKHLEEIIFTYGTTDGINLLAHSLGEMLEPGDEIVITAVEHHANIVPWQMLCERKNLVLKVVNIFDDGLSACHICRMSWVLSTRLNAS